MKWKLCVVYVLLFVITGGVLALYYYSFYELPWLRYVGPMKPVMTDFAPGDIVPMEVSRVSTSKTTRTFTSSREYVCDSLRAPVKLIGYVGTVDPGATTVTAWSARIPTEITDNEFGPPRPTPSGICHFEGVSEIQGTIRAIPVPWRSADFKVTAK